LPISTTTLLFVYNGSIVIIVRDERVFIYGSHGDPASGRDDCGILSEESVDEWNL
jgi:hypothetical protein